jgi:hypothetical protein
MTDKETQLLTAMVSLGAKHQLNLLEISSPLLVNNLPSDQVQACLPNRQAPTTEKNT